MADESGAPVPGARIVLAGPGSLRKVSISKADGGYEFTGLPPGDYFVSAAAPQLVTPKPAAIKLASNPQILDLRLAIVTKTEQLTVSENGAPTVSTDSSANAGAIVIQGADLQALSDDSDDLQADLQALAGPAAGPNGGAIFIDGFSGGQLPPKDSIREVRINQNPFSPEYDKLGFGRIEIFTKPGTDKFKGTIAYNFANDFWNARNPYAAQKAPLLLNESENSVNGPLNKRASFTLDVDRQAVDNGFIFNGVNLDPATLDPTPFNGIYRTPQRRFLVSPRIDYQLTQKNTLSVRYTFSDSEVKGAGIGSFDTISRGYILHNRFNTVQVSDTLALGSAINETRFQYFRWARDTGPTTAGPAILVLGAFNGGAAQVGKSTDTQNNFELQNYTSVLHGKHMWRFGARLREGLEDSVSFTNYNGAYTFTSIESYRLTLLGIQNGLTPAQIRASGGGASQFSINTGIPDLSVCQFDAGLFAGDDWRLRPNLTVSAGVRYEVQTNMHDYSNIAPRVGIAWAPGGGQRSKTVLRAGFGIFYDRFPLANTLTAMRFNGTVQQQFVINNPGFYPSVPAPPFAGSAQSVQVTQPVDSNLRASSIMQSAFTLERQIARGTTLTATYTNSRGLHVLRSEDINAPLPGSGLYPFGKPSPIFLMTSSGLYNQNQFIVNVNTKPLPQVSVFSYYVLNRALSNSDGLSTFPANPYNFAGEYGPASTDIRHRFLAGGSISTHWNVRLSPYVILQSGSPFDITTGTDLYGTTLFNGRPGIASSAGPGVIATSYGLLDPHPSSGESLIPRNYGRGPGQMTVNLRVGKSIGLGREKSTASSSPSSQPINAANMSGPGGLRGLFSPPSSDRRYNLTISLSARNLLNHTNPGPIIGNIMSPLFGRANQVAGGPNGEGFSENASNRRLELQMRFTF